VRKIVFHPDQLDDEGKKWWEDWQKESDAARDKILNAWETWLVLRTQPPKLVVPEVKDPNKKKKKLTKKQQQGVFDPTFETDVWKDLKKWLLKHVFNGQCAYCESPLKFDRYRGDAEHYRPKGSVMWRDLATNKKTKARCKLSDGTEIDHPGYFWLAYDWRNLMPACADCNSGGEDEEDQDEEEQDEEEKDEEEKVVRKKARQKKSSQGKVDQFPVQTAHVFQLDGAMLAPGDLSSAIECPKGSKLYFPDSAVLDRREQPLLLNPLNPSDSGDPGKHLRYGAGGCVQPIDKSPIGTHSIKVYRLDRLNTERQRAQDNARREYYVKIMESKGAARGRVMKELLAKYRGGKESFSTAALHHLEDEISFQKQLLPSR
jgi:hypothetical protein